MQVVILILSHLAGEWWMITIYSTMAAAQEEATNAF